MGTTILIVDDDKEIANLVALYLKNEGYEVMKAYDGKAALNMLEQQVIDLLILDIMMPKVDGLMVCEQVRVNQNIPILMLSAKVEDMDKIIGLMTGADDYVGKPFNPLELVARVKSLLRRANMPTTRATDYPTDPLSIHSLVIDKRSHTVQIEEKNVSLTPIEFDILYLLASNPNRVYSSEQIFEHVWQEEGYGTNKTVMVHVSNVREKLEKATKGEKIIQTVWGVGYKIDS